MSQKKQNLDHQCSCGSTMSREEYIASEEKAGRYVYILESGALYSAIEKRPDLVRAKHDK